MAKEESKRSEFGLLGELRGSLEKTLKTGCSRLTPVAHPSWLRLRAREDLSSTVSFDKESSVGLFVKRG